MHNFVSKFLIPFILSITVGLFPFISPSQACSQEGEPCGEGFGDPCCPNYTNDAGETRKLKCSTDSGSENTCIDDGLEQ